MKENLPPHKYPQRARNLGPRQVPREATEKAAEPRVLPAATIPGHPKPEKPAQRRASKPSSAE